MATTMPDVYGVPDESTHEDGVADVDVPAIYPNKVSHLKPAKRQLGRTRAEARDCEKLTSHALALKDRVLRVLVAVPQTATICHAC